MFYCIVVFCFDSQRSKSSSAVLIEFAEVLQALQSQVVHIAAQQVQRKVQRVSHKEDDEEYHQIVGNGADGVENLGHSLIYDYEGKILDEIEEIEGGVYAEIDLNKMYDFRKNTPSINDIKNSYEVIKK